MNIKKIVAGSLITSLSATVVVLGVGMFAPASYLDTISVRYFGGGTSQEVIALDKDGNAIDGATVTENPDGSITVKNASGDVIEDASTKTQAVASNDQPGAPAQQSPSTTSSSQPPQASSPTPAASTPKPSPTPSPTPTPPPTPTPTPTPTPPPPPPTPQCGSGGSCTAAQVATHNTTGNCWVIHSGKVYNITSYIPKHPKSSAMFNSNTCGKSITAYLTGTREPTSGARFAHSSGDISDINPYFIANLG